MLGYRPSLLDGQHDKREVAEYKHYYSALNNIQQHHPR